MSKYESDKKCWLESHIFTVNPFGTYYVNEFRFDKLVRTYS